MSFTRIAALLGIASLMTGSAPPKPPLAGVWGAPGSTLTLDANGGRLEQECASGSFGAIRTDRHGRFQARGRFETFQPGPQRADAPAGSDARFDGIVEGDTLHLTIHPAMGASQRLALAKGRRMKLIRCL